MSSGFFSFFAHAGMASALFEANIRPTAYAGSSAGALGGSCLAAGISPSAIRDEFFQLKREDFWDPARLPVRGGLLRGRLFRERLQRLLPATFGEVEPLTISVYDVLSRSTQTRREGDLPLAVHASCCVPLMFEPVWAERRPLLDGGIADRPGLHGVAAGSRVFYHHIVSRSPWRRKGSPALDVPKRAGLSSLAIEGLPRVEPKRLDQGPIAFEAAYRATQDALSQPYTPNIRMRI
jgi:NTE family protein